MKKRFQFDWGAREEQENIRKWFFIFGCEFTLKKNMLLIYVMDFFLLFSFSLSHITSNQSFFSFSHCLPCVWLCMSFFFHPHSLFLSMRYYSYSYTPKIKKKTDEIFSMFLHDSMFSSFLPFCVLCSALLLLLLLSSCILFCTLLCHVAFYIFVVVVVAGNIGPPREVKKTRERINILSLFSMATISISNDERSSQQHCNILGT